MGELRVSFSAIVKLSIVAARPGGPFASCLSDGARRAAPFLKAASVASTMGRRISFGQAMPQALARAVARSVIRRAFNRESVPIRAGAFA